MESSSNVSHSSSHRSDQDSDAEAEPVSTADSEGSDSDGSHAASTPDSTSADVSSPRYRLFSRKQVTLGTLFGTPLTGGLLMKMNYDRLGESESAANALMGGIAGLVLLIVLSLMVPAEVPGILFYGTAAFIANRIYASQQLDAFNTHQERGGDTGSTGTVVFLCVGITLALLLIGALYIFLG